ncbi:MULTISPECIES: MerR family transcriptional regulator [Streptomyces]|uniref:MerR family transcriptional regulator n=1 Tax=Streptomyces TaxID=1883 RepID=UPI0019623846|nr:MULTISPECIES: MerR family transcriptional regulator [Streptomyces]QRX96277.1 MerR family transcriptional regulator [Streptomyces noursei]UJB44968.1 MerR family transcriptional regulator [Streptomyces sp. A1-5]
MTAIDTTPVKSPDVDRSASAGPVRPRSGGRGRYAISEVAALTGLSAHTLRWYEQIGLMPEVERSHAGQRRFGEHDLEWLACLGKLRLTGMPIAVMVRFAELVRRGEETFDERREILERTRHEVLARIAELQGTLDVLETKIDFYAGARRASEGA